MIDVRLDVSDLVAGMQQFARGLETIEQTGGRTHAVQTAAAIRPRVPVLTGRLRSTVGTSDDAVLYGGGLPYARKIERRTHAVADAVAAGTATFAVTMRAACAREVGRL